MVTDRQFEIAMLALFAYRAAKTNDRTELLAILSTVRNRVYRTQKTYSEVIENFYTELDYFGGPGLRHYPNILDEVLTDPESGLLKMAEDVYDNESVDVTAYGRENGALYFSRVVDVKPSDPFQTEILDRQDVHSLVGTFGGQQFYR